MNTPQTILLTGGTSGIGAEAAAQFATANAHLILVGRDAGRGAQTAAAIQQTAPQATVEFWQADLSLMRETQQLAHRIRQTLPALDVLVHCAGVMLPQRTLTSEGLETVFAVQYLSRWLLTRELLPHLQAAPAPCVVTVSAGGMFPLRLDWDNLMGEKFYHGALALIHESIANDMQILYYQQHYPDVDFYCYGPFWVPDTRLMHTMPRWFQQVGAVSGRFFGYTAQKAGADVVKIVAQRPTGDLIGRNLHRKTPTRWKQNAANLQTLWRISEQLVADAVSPGRTAISAS